MYFTLLQALQNDAFLHYEGNGRSAGNITYPLMKLAAFCKLFLNPRIELPKF